LTFCSIFNWTKLHILQEQGSYIKHSHLLSLLCWSFLTTLFFMQEPPLLHVTSAPTVCTNCAVPPVPAAALCLLALQRVQVNWNVIVFSNYNVCPFWIWWRRIGSSSS